MIAGRLLHVFVSADAFARVGALDHCVSFFLFPEDEFQV